MRVRAFAKVNLALEVGALRSDGYHELRTLFQTIELADEIELKPADELTLEAPPSLPSGPDNLVLRAALALRREAGVERGAQLRLIKRIPAGGGLGGGSSDAAAVLLGLDRLWDTHAAPEDLFRLALSLGSDVPFFLLGGTAFGFGRGEKLLPVTELAPLAVVLLFPGIAISTREAFADLDAVVAAGREPSSARWCWSRLWTWREGAFADLQNDFEASVFARHPELRRCKEELVRAGAVHALLSGSGSTVYGLFADHAGAERAVESARAAGHHAVGSRLLDRASQDRTRFD